MELGVVTQPAITINNQTYRGEMNGFDIFKGICNGFQTQPKFCQGDQVWELLMYDDDEINEIHLNAKAILCPPHIHIRTLF